MTRSFCFATVLILVLALPLAGISAAEAPPRDDTAWLKEKGTLILEDSFDRDEDGNLAAAIGNGWNSATANRVPDVKQAGAQQIPQFNLSLHPGHLGRP